MKRTFIIIITLFTCCVINARVEGYLPDRSAHEYNSAYLWNAVYESCGEEKMEMAISVYLNTGNSLDFIVTCDLNGNVKSLENNDNNDSFSYEELQKIYNYIRNNNIKIYCYRPVATEKEFFLMEEDLKKKNEYMVHVSLFRRSITDYDGYLHRKFYSSHEISYKEYILENVDYYLNKDINLSFKIAYKKYGVYPNAFPQKKEKRLGYPLD